MDLKRKIIKVFDLFSDAWQLADLLRKGGVDAKVVSKHSVQVHPEHEEQAKRLLRK